MRLIRKGKVTQLIAYGKCVLMEQLEYLFARRRQSRIAEVAGESEATSVFAVDQQTVEVALTRALMTNLFYARNQSQRQIDDYVNGVIVVASKVHAEIGDVETTADTSVVWQDEYNACAVVVCGIGVVIGGNQKFATQQYPR
jgi:DNA mismatch repair ATPase MutL